jgi:hypothetical protein
MDAKEARRQATEQVESKVRMQLSEVYQKIQDAVKSGYFSTNYYSPLLGEVEIKLEEQGYEVHEHSNTKDGTTVTIKW